MATLNVANRTLFIGDNLPVLRGINSESIDLIATDPPFNKGVKAFEGIVTAAEDAEGKPVSYKDVWTWGDVQAEWTNAISTEHPALYSVIQAANASAGDDMGAFLCWLAVRVLECHRVLKPTGSMYLHIDHTAHAYVKTMMDAIFERKNFRNELVWRRATSHNDARQYGRIHDTILYYVKTDKATWNGQTIAMPKTKEEMQTAYPQRDVRGPVRFSDLTGAGVAGGESGKAWRGYDVSARGRHWAPPKSSDYAIYIEQNFIPGYRKIKGVHERLDALDAAGLIHHPKRGVWPGLKRYAAADKGNMPQDLILEPMGFTNYNKGPENTGYPTQKPLALYGRMLEASTNPGDIVLDPFAGCATTCVAAERLEPKRQWIGIDINVEAEDVLRDRLQRELTAGMNWNDTVTVSKDLPKRTDKRETVAPELRVVSRKRNAPRLPAREIRERLKIEDGQRCQGCGWKPPYLDYLQVDHKKPRSLDGADEMDNYTLLCDPCNRLKSNKLTLTELRDARVKEGRVDAMWWAEERWR